MRMGLAAGVALALAAIGGSAHAQTLGVAYSSIHRAYADAQSVRLGGAQALELHDVEYAGLRWSVVDFVFDRTGRLDHLSMHTDDASYEEILQAASARMQEPPSASNVKTPAGAEMQIRVCEQRNGGVTVTYEAAQALS